MFLGSINGLVQDRADQKKFGTNCIFGIDKNLLDKYFYYLHVQIHFYQNWLLYQKKLCWCSFY